MNIYSYDLFSIIYLFKNQSGHSRVYAEKYNIHLSIWYK